MKWIIALLLLTNFAAFCIMGIDKRRAVKGRWRIPERTLLLACAPFSALGGLLGMNFFHHKTHKPKFSIGVPAMLVVQVIALYALMRCFG